MKELKKVLRDVFSQYGQVLDVKMWRNVRMRGQAFVIYQTVDEAQRALDGVRAAEYWVHGKPLVDLSGSSMIK